MKTQFLFVSVGIVLVMVAYASQSRENKPAGGIAKAEGLDDGSIRIASSHAQAALGRATLSEERKETTRNESVAQVHTASSGFQRIVVVRLRRGTDLLDGLKKAVEQEKIRNAAILSGVGSLTSYHVHAVSNTTLPARNVYYKAEGPQDLLNVNGCVIDGRIHAHIIFSDDKKGLGGHLEPGTTVFTFAIVTLGVLEEGASLARFDDPSW